MKKYLLALILFLAFFLRVYRVGSIPPALYWDETSLGYNAYAILKSGHDEHGRFFPLTNFAAFGDYKPPLYIYATVPSILIFGLNEFATRFPSAFFGTLTVLLAYLIAKKIFEKERIALLASLFMAISPWHLQFSRGAFEANLGLFFSTLGIFLFLKFAEDNSFWIFPSLFSFLAGMYTFTGQRLFAPFILLVLIIQFRGKIRSALKTFLIASFISAIIFWPLFKFAIQTLEGRLRFEEVNIFRDLAPADNSTRYRAFDHFSFWSNIIHNRRFFYAHEYLIHYFDAFNPTFLFAKGDNNPRLSVQEVGELYYLDFALILSGVYFLFARRQKYTFLILGWLLVSPLGPATARETPHALRMIHILPTFQLIAAFGLYYLYKNIKYKRLFSLFVAVVYLFNFSYYLHMYYVHWPRLYFNEWQYGYKQTVQKVQKLYPKYDHIVITNALGRPYIYFLFYLKYDPNLYLKTAQIERDKFYFIDVKSFDKFIFSSDPNGAKPEGKTLYIQTAGNTPLDSQVLDTIKGLDGKNILEISTPK